jgi:predicted MFS family arabinose efflux permease
MTPFRIRDKNIWVVYAAIFLVGVAYGVYVSLLALHLDARGFSKPQIGSFAAWFAGGIIVFSLPAGALLRRFSAKTLLATSLLSYAGCAALFPYLSSYPAIAGARFFDGASSVFVWVACETVLLRRAERTHKALVTSLYAMSIAVGYVLGPIAAKLVVAASSIERAFVASSALAVLAALVVMAWLDRDPPEGAPAKEAEKTAALDAESPPSLGARAVLSRIKTSCFATFAYGYFQASVVLFLPLYLVEAKGITKEQTILVPAFFAAGMLLFSNVAGRIGDKLGHLRVMRVLAGIGLVMIVSFTLLGTYAPMCVAVFIAGATLASISPVSLALQGIVTARGDLARANGIYNFFYAAGMLLGPPVSSLVYGSLGGAAMLLHLAALWAGFVLFCTVFAADDPRARAGRSASLVPAE